MSDLTLRELDRDGALSEAIAAVHGHSRAELLRNAVVGGGVLLAALAAPPARAASADTTAILNYALAYEYLQSNFYTETERVGTVARMTERQAEWARTLGAHERAHVAILRRVLGDDAVGRPSFNFGGVTEDAAKFIQTAVAFEDLTVALLTGQVDRLEDPALASAVFSLLTVEARHAAWARRIAGARPVARAFDQPKSLAEVDRVIASTRFISTLQPRMKARGRPRFTG